MEYSEEEIRNISSEYLEEETRNVSSDSENEQITFEENSKGFNASIMIKQESISKIAATQLQLKKEKIFRMPSYLSKILRRKNEIYYCVSTKEMHIDISETTGNVYLPLITKEEINSKLRTMPKEIRTKIGVLHIGAIKILLKAEFKEGIDTPIKMALIDNRINDRKDCILGAAQGNLIYKKFIFSVYPKFGISLETKNIDQVLSFVHKFERSNLMNPGDKVFSLTYLVAYALSNSHHSIDYKKQEYIEIEDVFSEVGKIEETKFSEISPIQNNWALDIAKRKPYLGQRKPVHITGNNMEIGETNNTYRTHRNSFSEKRDLRSLSLRVDDLARTLKRIE